MGISGSDDHATRKLMVVELPASVAEPGMLKNLIAGLDDAPEWALAALLPPGLTPEEIPAGPEAPVASPGPVRVEGTMDARKGRLHLLPPHTALAIPAGEVSVESSLHKRAGGHETVTIHRLWVRQEQSGRATGKDETELPHKELVTIESRQRMTIGGTGRSESGLEELLADSGVASIFLDQELRLKLFTPAAAGCFNLAYSELGEPLERIAAKLPGDGVVEEAKAALASGEPLQRVAATGDGRWFLSRLSPFPAPKGKKRGRDDVLVLSYIDIAGQQRREAEQSGRLEMLAQSQRLVAMGSYRRDLETGGEEWSDNLYRLLGHEPGENGGEKESFIEHVPGAGREAFRRAEAEAIASPGRLVRGEGLFVKASGETRWGRLLFRVIPSGRAGTLVATVQDVTQQEKAGQELERYQATLEKVVSERNRKLALSEARLRTMIRHFPNGSIYLFDHNMRFIEANGQGPRSGTRDHYVGKTLAEALEPDLFLILEPYAEQVLAGRQSRLELSYQGEDYEAWFIPVPDPEGGKGYGLALTQIVTERKKLEENLTQAMIEARKAAEAKSTFLANMSHEIRTPLAGMLGMAKLMKNNPAKYCDEQKLNLLLETGGQLQALINDVLDLSRIESGIVSLAPEPTEVMALGQRLLNLHSRMAEEKGLSLEVYIADDVPATILVDRSKLEQVLNNLLSNALKFTEKGGVTLTLELDHSRQEEQLAFRVADTGIGIPSESMEHIFDNFYQAESFLTKKYKGTGLGLAISQRLANMMGGSIKATSTQGIGSRFEVYLPCQPQEAAPAEEITENALAPLARIRKLHVLVAEDNDLNRVFVVELLEDAGHEVVAAENGEQTLQMLEKQTFDVVLMDVQMPVMDGVEATRRIREHDGSKFDPRIPIIALTAHAMPDSNQRFIEAGMDAYLAKPLGIKELARILKSTVDSHVN